MAANQYTRTVTITPVSTAYSWDSPPSWITIAQVGSTDSWTITISANSGSARTATLTVRHDNTTTVDTINVTQAGASAASPTSTPVVPTSTPVPPTSTPIPPTSTPAAIPSFNITQTTTTLNDASNGAGNSTQTLNYQLESGQTGTPVVVSQGNYYSVTVNAPSSGAAVALGGADAPSSGAGTITIQSTDAGATVPQSKTSTLTIKHPTDAGVTDSCTVNLSQYQIPANTLVITQSSVSLNDSGGAGTGSNTFTYTVNSGAATPSLISKPTWSSVSVGAPSGSGSGTVTVTSIDNGSSTPQSLTGTITLGHAANPGIQDTITANLTQAYVGGGGGGGGGCLISGTQITLTDNSLVNIEDLVVGQVLKSTVFGDMPDGDNYETLSGWSQSNPVLSTTTAELINITPYTVSEVYNLNDGLLTSSGTHLHIIKRGGNWSVIKTMNIVEGDILMSTTGEITITSIVVDNTSTVVYKLDVETNDTFIANGIVTHNAKDVV